MVKALQCLAVLVIKSAERGIGKRGAAFGIGRPQALDPGLLAGIVAGHLAETIELTPGALPLLVIEATELAVARNDVAAERPRGLPASAAQHDGRDEQLVAGRLDPAAPTTPETGTSTCDTNREPQSIAEG